MCAYNLNDDEFDRILMEVEEESSYLGDPSETAPSAVWPPTIERQVLVTLAVVEGRYGALQAGWWLVPGTNPRIYNTACKYSPKSFLYSRIVLVLRNYRLFRNYAHMVPASLVSTRERS